MAHDAESKDSQFIIQDLTELEGVECPCGTTRRGLISETNDACTLHMVEISKDAKTHYHKALTEVYYFLEGDGQMELDGRLHAVRPGVAVLIPPGVRHRAVVGERPMKILNFVMPGFDPEDEWFD